MTSKTKVKFKVKSKVNIVVVGSVNVGKSTTTGHLIYKCGLIDSEIIDKIEKEAAELGKYSFKYAWILDKLKAERERGITIDNSFCRFETKNLVLNIIDTPGHKDFIKNMIMGISKADSAVLFISASDFDSTIDQTKEHAILAYNLGIKQLIIVINKMDMTQPPYDNIRFEYIKDKMSHILTQIGYDSTQIPFVPISGLNGDNLTDVSSFMPWFKGWNYKRRENLIKGYTLIDALDAIEVPLSLIHRPLRMPIKDVYKIGGIGTVPLGRVETGFMRSGMQVTFSPIQLSDKVSSLELPGNIEEAVPGDQVGFNVRNIPFNNLKRGFVVSNSLNDPAQQALSFIAHIFVLNHSNQITVGYTPVLECHTMRTACKFDKLLFKVHRRSGKYLEENPKYLKTNESGIIKLIPLQPICVEKFSEYPPLGRFLIRDMSQVVAVGIIKDVEKKT